MRIGPSLHRVPFVPQMEAVECGAAALAMVLASFGRHAPLPDLRIACGVSRHGSSALGIKRAAVEYGLNVRALRAEVDDLFELPLPGILHWAFNHFVVLERVEKRGATIVDPGFGRQFVSRKELDELFTGVALTFAPNERFRRSPPLRASFARYARTIWRARGSAMLILGLTLLLELGALLPPAIQQIAIDHIIRPKHDEMLKLVVLILGGALAIRLFVTYLQERIVVALELALDVALKTAFVEHLVSLPLSFFHQRSTGDLIGRVQGHSSVRSITQQTIAAFLNGLLVFGYAGLMLLYDRRLAAIVLSLSAMRLAVVACSRNVVNQAMSTEIAQGAREATALIQAVAAPEAAKAFGAEEFLLRRHANALVRHLNASLSRRALTARLGQVLVLFDGASRAMVLWLGGQAVIHDRMTIGVFAAFFTLQSLFEGPLEGLLGFIPEFQFLKSLLVRIDDVIDAASESYGSRSPKGLLPTISVEHVSFRYGPTEPDVLHDISLLIRPGEHVALVGRSGCGKSTLMALIAGLATPTSGVVRLDGRDIRDLDLREYRRSLGIVMQDPLFFNDTVRANICLHERDTPIERVREAARIACIDDALEALPDGYETRLGERAGRLSGGQRQRLAIARALVHRPSILLLDEATSALDEALQQRVIDQLRAADVTLLMIAHRLETVRRADRIVVLDAGRVVQCGHYQQLVAEPGLFRDMLRAFS